MNSSNAIVLAGQGRRNSSPFAVGLRETAMTNAAVKSAVVMPNAASRPGTRTKLTAEQVDARQQQRAEDDELIRSAQKGDRPAFDALVRRYDRSVLRLAMHVLGNEQDAQDVHQEAFLKAYRHLSNFRFECSFYTWLYRIVTNLCLDQLRRRKSRREDPSTALDGAGQEMDLLVNLTDGRASANPDRECFQQRKRLPKTPCSVQPESYGQNSRTQDRNARSDWAISGQAGLDPHKVDRHLRL
jgi:RNA polymerase sigma-70 factor (ECF subfamily)